MAENWWAVAVEDYENREDEGRDYGVQTSRADSSESSASDSDEAEWSDSY